MWSRSSRAVARSRKILDGGGPFPGTAGELVELVASLRKEKEYTSARGLLEAWGERVGERPEAAAGTADPDEGELWFLRAYCTFKDYGLPERERLDRTERYHAEIPESLIGDGLLRRQVAGLADAIKKQRLIAEAKKILRGEALGAGELLKKAKKLKGVDAFGYARKLVARARQDAVKDGGLCQTLRQQHALFTYKDTGLPVGERLDRALEILQSCDDLAKSDSPETLGLAGAIFKRKWEAEGQKPLLERSLYYYRKGYQASSKLEPKLPEDGTVPEIPKDYDYGYTGINAAFVLDQLAHEELEDAETTGFPSPFPGRRRWRARKIREHLSGYLTELYERIKKKQRAGYEEKRAAGEEADATSYYWWLAVTIAEALFGLQEYEKAGDWLQRGVDNEHVEPWEFKSTATQLIRLARLQGVDVEAGGGEEAERARKVVLDFLKRSLGTETAAEAALENVARGKLGIGFSGGGFRASLFHIGVLARLAELDLLRHVEAFSCVSGGSILGAYYYLEVRNLLQRKRDGEIAPADYVEIVDRLIENFCAGVEKNIRTRVVLNPLTSLRMVVSDTYSATERVGELYEKLLYARIDDGENGRPRWISDLYVEPAGEPVTFSPGAENWRRRNKVPALIVNATSLNTCHNWQFTASFMGESPSAIDAEIDGNNRLRRMYYWEAPERHRRVRLGRAVASSSCVPGMFEPIVFHDLYPDYTVRLVDGGVHDNQGITGLLEQDCSVLVLSDCSGQTGTERHPGGGALAAVLRSNAVLMARVREAQFQDVKKRRRSGLLRGLMIVHMKQGLDVDPVDWIDCEDPAEASDEARSQAQRGPLTPYGVRKDIQEMLAAVRTDLDAFSEAEAYALMASGYMMVGHQAKRLAKELGLAAGAEAAVAPKAGWKFLQVLDPMQRKQGFDAEHQRLRDVLEAARSAALKVFLLSKPLRIGAFAVLAAIAAGILWWQREALVAAGGALVERPLVLAAIVLVAVALFGKSVFARGLGGFWRTLVKAAIALVASVVGWVVAGLYLVVFNPWYLRLGRAAKVMFR